MGGHKQQLIADQVELGDRIPAPIPARQHVAMRDVKRRDARMRARAAKVAARNHALDTILAFLLGAVTVAAGFLLVALV